MIIDRMRQMGPTATREIFAFRSDNQVVWWQRIRAGLGIGLNKVWIGDEDILVRRILTPQPIGALPLWRAAHQAVRQIPRVRRVCDRLAKHLERIVAASHPPG